MTVLVKTPVKAKVPSLRQQAVARVNASYAPQTAAAETAATKALNDAKAQAQQALGFQNALAQMNQGDAGRIHDAYTNAAKQTSAYGDLALASAGDSSRSAASQAQDYIRTVGPDVGGETRPDISGALRALGALGVGDRAASLTNQGTYAQERATNTRDAQLMRLADLGIQAGWQGRQNANTLRSDEVARQAASRGTDIQKAIDALHVEARATDDQRIKDQAFKVDLAQKQVDLAAAKLANATGEIARKKAQFDLDNAQKVLDTTLAATRATTAATVAATAGKKGAGGLTPYQNTQMMRSAAADAGKLFAPKDPSNPLAAATPVLYEDALHQLLVKYPALDMPRAVNILNAFYKKPGENGRPPFSYIERAALQKKGYSPQQITAAMSGYINAAQFKDPNTPGYDLYVKMHAALG